MDCPTKKKDLTTLDIAKQNSEQNTINNATMTKKIGGNCSWMK